MFQIILGVLLFIGGIGNFHTDPGPFFTGIILGGLLVYSGFKKKCGASASRKSPRSSTPFSGNQQMVGNGIYNGVNGYYYDPNSQVQYIYHPIKKKKPFYKKFWFWLIVVLALIGFAGSNDLDGSSIELVAGEEGEYGELFTINKGTEFEETYYIYRIPAATYTVTNTGDYMGQFSVYGETVYITEEGWEELSDVFYAIRLDVGESDTVEIGEGQIIEIHEPDQFTLVPVN